MQVRASTFVSKVRCQFFSIWLTEKENGFIYEFILLNFYLYFEMATLRTTESK